MSLLSLMWANLFRRRTRTTLTVFSLVAAFTLFMLLRAVASAFAGGVSVSGADRLVISGKYSITDGLPFKYVNQVMALDGIEAVAHSTWFGGTYLEPQNFFGKFPVDPQSYFNVFSEYIIDPAVLSKFASMRTGAVAGKSLAEKYGWQTGDVIPIMADIWPKADGSRLWEFELLGTFDQPEQSMSLPLLLINYAYFDEAVGPFRNGQIGQMTVRVSDPERLQELAVTIDDLFENSPDPTRTATEDETSRQFAGQLGDMGFITTMILSAVFFTIILLTGNTMAQALRERIPELAVLKTLGFTDVSVALLVMGEGVLLCLIGGLGGVGLALSLEGPLNVGLASILGVFEMTSTIIFSALGLALAVGIVIGGIPAVSAMRLTIVDALRKH